MGAPFYDEPTLAEIEAAVVKLRAAVTAEDWNAADSIALEASFDLDQLRLRWQQRVVRVAPEMPLG